MTEKLSDTARETTLAPLLETGWSVVSGRDAIQKEYRFKSFIEAFGFMTKVAIEAEEMNHHPWWSNVYNRVEFKLNTHDAGDIVTEKDHKLAELIDRLAES